MIFHSFNSQEERRNYGGSAFIELQYCRLPVQTDIKEIVSVESIDNWKNDSLYIYIDDDNMFYQEYSKIFDHGIYNNLMSGTVDMYGINYYAPSLTDSIIERLNAEKPSDHETLIEWLKSSKQYNGFYILGI